MDYMPDEDRWLNTSKPDHEHCWVDSYVGGGFSKKTPDKMILVFFCKKCLEIRKKILDSSDTLIAPETLELYEDQE